MAQLLVTRHDTTKDEYCVFQNSSGLHTVKCILDVVIATANNFRCTLFIQQKIKIPGWHHYWQENTFDFDTRKWEIKR